jgi:hypothetical protein
MLIFALENPCRVEHGLVQPSEAFNQSLKSITDVKVIAHDNLKGMNNKLYTCERPWSCLPDQEL